MKKKRINKGRLHIKTEYEAIARNEANHQKNIGKKAKVEKHGNMYHVYVSK